MSVDVDRVLDLIDQTRINKDVLMKHDVARESFTLPKLVVGDHQEFQYLITSYVEHHFISVGEAKPNPATCFGEAKRMLEHSFDQDRFQDGYARALQVGLDGSNGGMRAVLNEIADALRIRALQAHIDHVYYHHINVLSKEDNLALSRAFFQRFGPILRRFGFEVDESTFSFNTRDALEYHRQALEQINGIANKI